VDALAEHLDVAPETVQEMESRMASIDVPYDGDADTDDENFHAAPAGYLQDMRYNPEVLVNKSDQEDSREERVNVALSSLDGRSRDIIRRRWLNEDKPTLHELAEEYGISAERVRQIEAKALTVMKDKLLA
jgi:RNA polymerase sigma-32 factor